MQRCADAGLLAWHCTRTASSTSMIMAAPRVMSGVHASAYSALAGLARAGVWRDALLRRRRWPSSGWRGICKERPRRPDHVAAALAILCGLVRQFAPSDSKLARSNLKRDAELRCSQLTQLEAALARMTVGVFQHHPLSCSYGPATGWIQAASQTGPAPCGTYTTVFMRLHMAPAKHQATFGYLG